MSTNSNPQPIVKMQDDGSQASIVNYNVPEPTTYFGNKYFELNLKNQIQSDKRFKGKDWREIFSDFDSLPFKGRSEAMAILNQVSNDNLLPEIQQILKYGYNHSTLPVSTSISSSVNPKAKFSAFSPVALSNSISQSERRYLVAKLIYLPADFEGLEKIKANINRELVKGFSTPQREFMANDSINQIVGQSIDFRSSLKLHSYEKLIYLESYDFIADRLREGNFLALFRKFSGQYDYQFIPIPEEITPKFSIIEKYKLSSFLGNYGAGRTIKTFTLLPGEKTTITVKTFKKTTFNTKETTSILDSHTTDSADDFEKTINNERSDKHAHQDKLDWHVNVNEDLDFGFSDTKIDAGISGESANQREDMTKQVTNSVTKHAEKASSKRDVNIDTSYERKEESGEETSTVREIENINVGRTLNFVFRQMNQEFLTLFHLIDAKVAYSSGLPGSYEETSISGLGTPENVGDFLKNKLTNQIFAKDILEGIVNHLCFIADYTGTLQSFLERVKMNNIPNPVIPTSPLVADYIKPRFALFQPPVDPSVHFPNTYVSPDRKLRKTVAGIIVSAQTTVMRTEGIMVEALLGQGDALDSYSHGLQDEKVREQNLNNNKIELANSIIENNQVDNVKLFGQVYPCCPSYVYGCNCGNSQLINKDNNGSDNA